MIKLIVKKSEKGKEVEFELIEEQKLIFFRGRLFVVRFYELLNDIGVFDVVDKFIQKIGFEYDIMLF